MLSGDSSRRYGAPAIVWFRDDLRLSDNPAVREALASNKRILCLYVRDQSDGLRAPGRAQRWWLAKSLRALERHIADLGGRLILRRGAASEIIPALAAEVDASGVYWNRRYDAGGIAIDALVEKRLTAAGVKVKTSQASLLFEPQAVRTLTGAPQTLFTSFWWQARRLGAPRLPMAPPPRLDAPEEAETIASEQLEDWRLEPVDGSAEKLDAIWTPGEAGARKQLETFLGTGLGGYATRRDRLDLAHTSRLSPHIRFGELSPFQIWQAARLMVVKPIAGGPQPLDVEKFLGELAWREFSYHILFHHPSMMSENYQKRFDRFPWQAGGLVLKAWQEGRTGYPVVDAGMRQLAQTGWIHHRTRTIVASFLIKHLMFDWRAGEAWFWDNAVDADIANNPAGWQWVAGSGADATPFFRMSNPLLQATEFDPQGDYVRRWVPELARLPKEFIHVPWHALSVTLAAAGIKLGENYPRPIVDHRKARERAMAAYQALKPAVA